MNKALDDFTKRIGKLKGGMLNVGWDSTYPTGESVGEVALLQEFGRPGTGDLYEPNGNRIPPRPFIRPVIQAHKAEWAQELINNAREVAARNTDNKLNRIGDEIVRQIRESIDSVAERGAEPLHPVTLVIRKWHNDGTLSRSAPLTRTVIKAAWDAVRSGVNLSNVDDTLLKDTGYMYEMLTHKIG